MHHIKENLSVYIGKNKVLQRSFEFFGLFVRLFVLAEFFHSGSSKS